MIIKLMNTNKYSGNKNISIAFYSLSFFLAFEFIFAQTIFKSQMLIYFMMVFNLLSFVFCCCRYGCKSNFCAKLWLFYICLHICSLCFNGNISTLPYWIISLILLFIPSQIAGVFNPKVFIYIGLFFAGGVFFQFLFPSLYHSYVYPLFIETASEFIESSLVNEFGFSGFSPQTGTTAYLLLISQSVLLAFKNKQVVFNSKLIEFVVLLVFMLAIFLTGKRMPSLISVLLFFVSLYISNPKKNIPRDIVILSLLLLVGYCGYHYFINNADQFVDNVFLRRFAISYISSSDGSDITSGRSELYKKAWALLKQEPIIGIGANNYSKMSNMGTSVHNTYLQVLCEEGVLRFPLFIVPLLFIFFKTIKEVFKKSITNSRSFLLLSFFLQIVFILYSLTGNTFINTINFVFYFMGVSFFAHSLRYR